VVVSSTDVTGVNISLHAGITNVRGVIRAEGDSKLDYSKLFVVLMPAADTDTESTDISEGYGNGSGSAEVAKDGSFKLDVEPSASLTRLFSSLPPGAPALRIGLPARSYLPGKTWWNPA